MNYDCGICNRRFHNKSNYNRHLKSKAHADVSIGVSIEVSMAKKCKCGKEFTHSSSLSRHRRNCHNKNNTANEVTELKEQVAELTSTIKKLVEFSDRNTTINSNNNTTYKISIKNYIQQTYPNAPPLEAMSDYSRLAYKEYKLLDTIVYHYENKNLHKYLGDFIISHYKKNNPAEQSMWSSDISRLTYIVSELLESKKSIWSHDFKGARIKDYIIMPLLNYIRNCIDEYWNSIEVKKCNIKDIQGIEAEFMYRNKVAQIASLIDNNILADDIIKYIAPYFSIDKYTHCLLENGVDENKSHCFIDKEIDDDNKSYHFVD
jgi:hypothetical protein